MGYGYGLNNFVENFVTLIFLIAIDICRKKYNMQKIIEDIMRF